MITSRFIFFAAALLGCLLPTNGQIFVYNFTAEVNDGSIQDQQGVFPASFNDQVVFQGTLSWDSAAAPIASPANTQRYQDLINGVSRLSITGGGISIDAPGTTSTSAGFFQVSNELANGNFDSFIRQTDIASVQYAGFNQQPNASGFGTFDMALGATEVFADTSIPTSLNLADFDQVRNLEWFVQDTSGNFSLFTATVTSLVPVPEPSQTALAFALVCSAALLWRRLRRRPSAGVITPDECP